MTYDPHTTLADIPLTGGWEWVTGSTVPTVAQTDYPVVLAVDDGNYNYTGVEDYDAQAHTINKNVALTVNKAVVTPPVIVEKPAIGGVQIADVKDTDLYTVKDNRGGLHAGTYPVVLTLRDPANYRWLDGPEDEPDITLEFLIEQIKLPTTAPVTYTPGLTLKDIPLVNEEGWNWEWVHPDSPVTVVNAGYQVVLRDVLDDQYDLTGLYGYDAETHTITRKIEVTVNKATVTAPAIASKTYTGEAQRADVEKNSLYTVAKNDDVTDAGEYDVLLKLVDAFNYAWPDSNKATTTLKFRITQASAPAVVEPTPAAITYDPETTLANVPLTGGWKWVEGTTVPTVGNDGYPATLTVDDANYDYSGMEGYDPETHAVTRTLALTADKTGSRPAAVEANLVTYDGNEHLLVTVSGTAVGGEMRYFVGDTAPAADSDDWNNDIPRSTNAGDYTVWYFVKGDANHFDSEAASVRVTVSRATVYVTVTLVASAVAYGKLLKDGQLSGGSVELAIEGDFAWAVPDTTLAVADSGKTQFAVTFTPVDQTNYRPATCYITVMVTPTNSVAIPPTAISSLVYNGKAQALVQAGSAIHGTMKYAVGQTAPAEASDWSENVPTGTDAGTYYVWYKIFGDENHLDTDSAFTLASIVLPEFGYPDFIMPEGLTAIEAGAFEGVTSMAVVDAHACAFIGQDAFKGTGLKQIRLPKDCAIDSAAFDEEGVVYVFAPAGGTTQSHCAERANLVFIPK